MNFLLSIIRRCPLLPTILKLINNERGQTPGTFTSTQGVDPALSQFLLGVRKPATGLLGEGAFSALGADPNQFARMSGLPAMAGAQDLFRINPAEAEQMSLGESKARENILNNTPMRGGELNQGLAQNAMHFGGLRQKLTEDRRNQALNALGSLGSNIPVGFSGTSNQAGTPGTSTFDKLAALLGPTAIKSFIGPAAGQLAGLLGLGTNTSNPTQTLSSVDNILGPSILSAPNTSGFDALAASLMFPTDISSSFDPFAGGLFT